ncbi:LptF/LptG family permease [Hwanghaeella sp.]|uniref:LptF/LptG family permease n=1 Tax=Hwanghaeella sp. TaxID=2605943 RepID=UPI003CCC0D52
MNSITRHMTGQILTVAIVASVILCTAVVLQQSVRFVDLIVNRGLPASDLAYLSVLITPRVLSVVLPVAVFGATIFTYHRMQSGSELIILRSAGMNSFRLAKPGLIAAIVCTFVSYFFALYLMPVASQELRSYLSTARSEIGSVLIKEGQFNAIRENLTVYARRRAENGDLIGLVIHSEQTNGEHVTVIAERGALVNSPSGARILLANGRQQTLSQGQLHDIEFEEYVFDLVEKEQAGQDIWQEPRERFLPDLLSPSNSPGDVAYRGKLIAEGHSRLAQPLLAIAYVAAGLVIFLKTEFSRQSNAKPILVAIAIMVGLLVSNLGLISSASKYPALIPVMYGMVIVPTLLALFLLARPQQLKRRPAPPDLQEA